jgi:hypothetical protein
MGESTLVEVISSVTDERFSRNDETANSIAESQDSVSIRVVEAVNLLECFAWYRPYAVL